MKIGREDFEALIKGEKDISSYIELDPVAGTYSVFGVKTASNPNYLIKAIYEMYEGHLNKKLAVKAVRKLFRSVGCLQKLPAQSLRIFRWIYPCDGCGQRASA